MALSIKYLDMKRGKKVLDPMTFNEQTVWQAHEIKKPYFVPHVNLSHLVALQKFIEADDLDSAKEYVKALGL